ncbi:MAG: M48 family metallopeptidase [Pseudomonadota bacterium]|nr:M48 family metallopeptidase [Pseudomonadota bacterium]
MKAADQARDAGRTAAGKATPPRWRRRVSGWLAAACVVAASPAAAREGVDVGPPSVLGQLVSERQVEQAAVRQYSAMLDRAADRRALGPENHPQVQRLRAIAARLIPQTYAWNPHARDWRWEINLIGSKQINAFCMPGGKIVFYYGILDQLKLSDAEVAMVMGHEMAHALREHAREQMGKNMATRGAIEIGSAILGLGNGGRLLADMGGQLLTLRFGRADETEADLVGLELAARAGYDPRAAITLWQKMAAASRRSPVELLSTHPSGPTRISDIEANIPKVEGLYARAAKPTVTFGPPLRPPPPAAPATSG